VRIAARAFLLAPGLYGSCPEKIGFLNSAEELLTLN
jgi:hypothetical protein